MRAPVFILAAAVLAACSSGSGRPTGTSVPPADTIRTVTGHVGYESTGPRLGQRTVDGRLIQQVGFLVSTPVDAPHVPVEILRLDGTVVATTVTDPQGRYQVQVNFGPNPAAPLLVRTTARLDLPFGTTVRVFPNASATEPYTHTSSLGGNPNDSVMTIDLVVRFNNGAAAYAILKALRDPFIVAKSGITDDLPDLDVFWEPGNGDESVLTTGPTRATLLVAGGITGDDSSNQDAWDPPKLARILGEYLVKYFFIVRAPEGMPSPALLVPTLAWREGFLDFWACISRGDPEYWDTEGTGSEGRVIRFFNIESFFEPTGGPIDGEDPNVYQDPSVVGFASPFSIAEVLWDIHDSNEPGTDGDNFQLQELFLTLRFLARQRAGFSYPYFYTLLNEYARAPATIPVAALNELLRSPEDQGMRFPATIDNGLIWPPQISPDGQPGLAVSPPFQKTVSDIVDTLNPSPGNDEVGFFAQRYHLIDIVANADLTASVSPSAGLIVDILDLDNNVLASGPSPQTLLDLPARRYLIRIRSSSDPQETPFDLTVTLSEP